ncbi:hypothetical protein TNCV_3910681 [Trichonephila clavipes]|nr:hypothetical protein TNCV_3910681 [Trichonephila clavipes]
MPKRDCGHSSKGHGYEFVAGVVESQIRDLIPMMIFRAEILIHVNSVVAENPQVGKLRYCRICLSVCFEAGDNESKLLRPSPPFLLALNGYILERENIYTTTKRVRKKYTTLRCACFEEGGNIT